MHTNLAQKNVPLREIIAFFAFSLCFFFLPLFLHAQIVGEGTTINFSPTFPAENTVFEARVEAFSYNIDRARIEWIVDGVVQKETGQTITLIAPEIGILKNIRVRVIEETGSIHTVEKALVPSTIDLVIEGDTRVPHFYTGRALPSAGSDIRVVAFPSIYSPGGTLIDSKNLIYTWRVDKKVVSIQRGQQVLKTTMSKSGDLLVGLSVSSLDGTTTYETFQKIKADDPEVVFYEDNPLFGLSQNALPETFTLLENEISVRAEPFFVSNNIFQSARTEWRINSAPSVNPNTNPQILTLRKTGGSGQTRVSFSVRNLHALRQSAEGKFILYFE